jgi:hypothetical protein
MKTIYVYLELEVLRHALRSPIGVNTDELELHILFKETSQHSRNLS